MRIVIKGNHENIKGNPLPYLRQTQGSYWNDKSKRYHAWVNYVIDQAYTQLGLPKKYDLKKGRLEKPFTTEAGTKTYLKVISFFKDLKHADSENVRKGIADALFKNDKFLAGSDDFDYDKNNPRVEIEIN